MRVIRCAGFVLTGASLVAAAIVAGCSSDSGSPPASNSGGASSAASGSSSSASSATSRSTTSDTSGTSSSAAASTTTDPGSSTSTSSVAGSTSTGTSSGSVAVCPSTLQDKVTACTVGVDPPCAKGCGPKLASGSSEPNLGNKTCTCTGGVYVCASCAYENPVPGCYVVSTSAATCDSTVADKGTCTTPCTGGGTGNDVCTMTSDAGKNTGCVCIQGSSGPVWTCATLPW